MGYFTVVCLVAKPLIWSEAEGDLVVKGLATKHATVKWTIDKKPGESPVGVLSQNSVTLKIYRKPQPFTRCENSRESRWCKLFSQLIKMTLGLFQ